MIYQKKKQNQQQTLKNHNKPLAKAYQQVSYGLQNIFTKTINIVYV